MYRHAFSGLESGSQVWIVPSGQYLSTHDRLHVHTALELEPLRDLLGDDAEAVISGPWTFIERHTCKGRSTSKQPGAYGWLRSQVNADVELRVHRDDVSSEPPREAAAPSGDGGSVVTFTASPAVISPPTLRVLPSITPATCERLPARRPWADNERVGAIYVEREPGGSYRVSLVLTGADGVGKQAQSSTGLLPDDVAPAVELCARRLTTEAQRRAGSKDMSGKAGDA